MSGIYLVPEVKVEVVSKEHRQVTDILPDEGDGYDKDDGQLDRVHDHLHFEECAAALPRDSHLI